MMDKVKRARDFAVEAHKGQERKFSGLPYVAHPATVSFILSEYEDVGEDELAAAFLHDVLEDTDVVAEDLEREFGETITFIVEDLTSHNSESLDKTVYLKTKMMEMPDPSLRVKLADRLHNVSDLHLASDSFRERYSESTKELVNYVRYHRDSLGEVHTSLCERILNVPAFR